jgi:hypothetical protein
MRDLFAHRRARPRAISEAEIVPAAGTVFGTAAPLPPKPAIA